MLLAIQLVIDVILFGIIAFYLFRESASSSATPEESAETALARPAVDPAALDEVREIVKTLRQLIVESEKAARRVADSVEKAESSLDRKLSSLKKRISQVEDRLIAVESVLSAEDESAEGDALADTYKSQSATQPAAANDTRRQESLELFSSVPADDTGSAEAADDDDAGSERGISESDAELIGGTAGKMEQYDQAEQLARQGVSKEEIAARLGLPLGEVEVILGMAGRSGS